MISPRQLHIVRRAAYCDCSVMWLCCAKMAEVIEVLLWCISWRIGIVYARKFDENVAYEYARNEKITPKSVVVMLYSHSAQKVTLAELGN